MAMRALYGFRHREPMILLIIPLGPDEETAKTFILRSSHIFEHLRTHDVHNAKNDEEGDDGDGDGEGKRDEGGQEGEQEKHATVGTLRRSKRGTGAAGGGI